ncbi:MAG: hypothetical protein K5893_09400 [Prevotella sp.]|nr:hypothetical protein [Prevotella sp.]
MKEFTTRLWMTIALLTATLNTQATLPFHTTDDPTDGSTYWYQIYSKYSTYLAVFTDTLEISNFQNNIPDFRWCFIGNETDGFKIYNERSRLFITDEGKSTADPFDAGIFFCETRGDSVLLKTDSPWGVPVYLCWSIFDAKVLETSTTNATPFFFNEMIQRGGPAPGIAESEMRPLRAIRSTGNQSFNTYYVHKANTRIEMRCNVAPNTSGNQAAFGSFDAYNGNTKNFTFYVRQNGEDICRYERSGGGESSSNFVYGEDILISCEGKTATWYRMSDESTPVGSITTQGTPDNGSCTLMLFNTNMSSTRFWNMVGSVGATMTLYGCKIWEGDRLVRDYIPVEYNNEIGLYDRVNHSFRAAYKKKFCKVELPIDESEVTFLDNIVATGAQAFNTDYVHNEKTSIKMDCKVPHDPIGTNTALFGSRWGDELNRAFCFYTRYNGEDKPAINCNDKTNVSATNNFIYDKRINVILGYSGSTYVSAWHNHDNNAENGVLFPSCPPNQGVVPLFLFDVNTSDTQGGAVENNTKSMVEVYGCKIYDGDVLVRDYVPAKYKGVIGLFDRVNKTFGGSCSSEGFHTNRYVAESDVTRLVSIQSTGKQAFNTKYIHKANTRVDIEFLVSRNFNYYCNAIFGACLGDVDHNAFSLYTRYYQLNELHINRTGSVQVYDYEVNSKFFNWYNRVKMTCEGNTAKWYAHDNLDELYDQISANGTVDDGVNPIIIFSRNGSDKPYYAKCDTMMSRMELFSFKVYEGDKLMRDYIPADYKGEKGLYDRVTGTFDGSMTDTPFIGTALYVDSCDITRIEAVKANGKQSINTHVYAVDQQTQVKMDCMFPTQAKRADEALWGTEMTGDYVSGTFSVYSRSDGENRPRIKIGTEQRRGYKEHYDFYDKRVTIYNNHNALWMDYPNGDVALRFTCDGYTVHDGYTPIALFDVNDSNVPDSLHMAGNRASVIFYGCKIKIFNTNVRDFVPAKYKGVVGIYDRVNNGFYPSTTMTPFYDYSEPAFNPGVITEQPEGEVKDYLRSGRCILKSNYYYNEEQSTVQKVRIVYANDGKTIYMKDPVYGQEMGTWVKGTISDDGTTISIPNGQYFYWNEEYDYGAILTWGHSKCIYSNEDNDHYIDFTIDKDVENITYTVDKSKGTISLNNSSGVETTDATFVDLFTADGVSCYLDLTEDWVGFLEYNTVLNEAAFGPGTPQDPYDLNYLDNGTEDGDTWLYFTIPPYDTYGNTLDIDSLSYVIYTDGKPFVFEKSLYTNLPEDMTEIPFNYLWYDYYGSSVNFYRTNTASYHKKLFHHSIGVQSIYRFNGKEYRSNKICLYNETPTGIDDVTTEEKDKDWYDMSGRKLNGPTSRKGIYVVGGKKVIVK